MKSKQVNANVTDEGTLDFKSSQKKSNGDSNCRIESYRQLEPKARVEIGGYVHQYPGKVTAKMYVSDVNKPLVVDDADVTKKMKRFAVEMRVIEDKTPNKNVIYQKDATMDQINYDDMPGDVLGTTTTSNSSPMDMPTTAGMIPDQEVSATTPNNDSFMLKNMIKTTNCWLMIAAGVAIIALSAGVAAMFMQW